MTPNTVLFQGKEIDLDDESGETADMIHHPDHYTWKGTLLSDLAKAEEYTKFLRELFMEDGGKA